MGGLSINHYLTPAGYPLATFLDDAVAAGGSGVGLTERALAEMSVPALRRMLRDRNLRVTSVNSAGFFLWDDPARAKRQPASMRSFSNARPNYRRTRSWSSTAGCTTWVRTIRAPSPGPGRASRPNSPP